MVKREPEGRLRRVAAKRGFEQAVTLARVRAMCESGEARRIRHGARLSLSEVGHAVGASTARVSRWERAVTQPRGHAARRYYSLLSTMSDLEK